MPPRNSPLKRKATALLLDEEEEAGKPTAAKRQRTGKEQEGEEAEGGGGGGGLERAGTSFCRLPALQRLAPHDLREIRVLGSGSCGEVVLADWNGTLVAVKKIYKSLLHSSAYQEFKAEAKMLA
jgi:hypothetical protein